MSVSGLVARFALLSLCASAPLAAQDAPAAPPAAGAAPVPDAPAAPMAVARLAPVIIDILDAVGSKTSKSLDTFRIALAEPLVVDGVTVIPAGTPGMGEVVHAKKAGGMGAPGELVIAARYLELDGRKIRLRSTVIDAEGKSRVNGVNTLAMASAATIAPVAVIGFFIKGGEIELPAGTRAFAKLAEDFSTAAPPAPAATSTSAPADGAAAGTTGGTTE